MNTKPILRDNETKPPKKGWMLIPCDGEAHDTIYIDNCWSCAPRWGVIEVHEVSYKLGHHRSEMANRKYVNSNIDLLVALKMAMNQLRSLSEWSEDAKLPRPETTKAWKKMEAAIAKTEAL